MAHYLILTAGTEDSDAEYTFECTGVTDACTTWVECEKCSPTPWQAEELEGESHGEFHQYVNGYWSYDSDRCGLFECDVEIGYLYYRVYDDGYGNDQPKLPSGRYEITIDDWDEGTVFISLKEETK